MVWIIKCLQWERNSPTQNQNFKSLHWHFPTLQLGSTCVCSRWSRICLQEMCVCMYVLGGGIILLSRKGMLQSLFSVIWLCEITPTLPPTACSRIPSAELHGPLIKSLNCHCLLKEGVIWSSTFKSYEPSLHCLLIRECFGVFRVICWLM